MKSTGIIRRIDDLGRVVIPKEIRRNIGLREGDPMEIFIEDRKVILEKYCPLGNYAEQAGEYIKSFRGVAQRDVLITDIEKVIASVMHTFSDAPLSNEMIEAIRYKRVAENIPLLAGENGAIAAFVAIIGDGSRGGVGESIGAVVLLQGEFPVDTAIKTQMKIAADFLGRLANMD